MSAERYRSLKLDRDAICAAYISGTSIARIAQTLNCSQFAIYYHLDKGGVKPAKPRLDDLARLMAYVKKADNGCWIWTGYRAPSGYGRTTLSGRPTAAHVAMFIITNGPVPDGREIDHQCHNRDLHCAGGDRCQHRACVNPDHLESVTKSENKQRAVRRITHCPQGHEYTHENTLRQQGKRSCRACNRARCAANQRFWKAKARAFKIESILRHLDVAGIPLDWDARRSRLAITHIEIRTTPDVWQEAIQIRRRMSR